MKKISLLIVIALIIVSCQDSILKSHENKTTSDSGSLVFQDHVTLIDGTLRFNSKESFEKVTDYVLSSPEVRETFLSTFEKSGFNSQYYYYENFPEKKVLEMAKSQNIPEKLSPYFVLTENNGELTLEKNLQSNFLRLYFNDQLKFFIKDDEIRMEGSSLFLIKDGEKHELKDESKYSSPNLRATGSYTQYSHNGKDYRLKVESDTRWGSVSLYVSGQGYLNFWNYVEYWAHHRKRPWGVWIAEDTYEVAVYGSHWIADPSTGAYFNQSWSPGTLYNTNEAAWYGNYVHSYSYTGYCLGLDNQPYYVTISETN